MEASNPYSGIPRKEGRSWRFWASLVVVAITIIFILVNSQEVEVNFIVGKANLPLIFALAISVGLGFVLGYVLPKLRDDRRRDDDN